MRHVLLLAVALVGGCLILAEPPRIGIADSAGGVCLDEHCAGGYVCDYDGQCQDDCYSNDDCKDDYYCCEYDDDNCNPYSCVRY